MGRTSCCCLELCLLLTLAISLLSSAKTLQENSQNEENKDDEWRKSCENARELCDKCEQAEWECLKVERCRENPSGEVDETCAGVQLNDIAVNNFCAHCRQNEQKCQTMPSCVREESKPPQFPEFPSLFRVRKCGKEGAPCRDPSDRTSCCRQLTCQTSTADSQKQSICKAKTTQQHQHKPSSCKKEGSACRRTGDTSCCQGLSCEKSSNVGKPGPQYQCVALVLEPVKPSEGPEVSGSSGSGSGGTQSPGPGAQNSGSPNSGQQNSGSPNEGPLNSGSSNSGSTAGCRGEGSHCAFTGDPSCCPALSCESSGDLGTPGPPFQCVGLKTSEATTASSCTKEGGSCTLLGDTSSCCPQLNCEKSSDIGLTGPEYQCIALIYGEMTTAASTATSDSPAASAPIDATMSYNSQ